eukprot:gene8836-18302_t
MGENSPLSCYLGIIYSNGSIKCLDSLHGRHVLRKLISPDCATYESSSIPSCESCGSARAFEFQLMPGLLHLLLGSGGIMGDIGGNLDIGVVCVWSCIANCAGGTEEVVVVQPSVDSAAVN